MNRLAARLLCLAFLFAAASPVVSALVTDPRPPTAAVSASELLDINTATPAQLKTLMGIGDAYAKRIIEGRPYTAKNQLTTRGIVPQPTYDAIKDQIIARAAKK